MEKSPNGDVKIPQPKRNSTSKFLVLLAVPVIILAISVNYIYKSPTIKPVNDKPTAATTIKNGQNHDYKEMGDFLDFVISLDLDDFVTIEKEPIKIKDLIRFNNIHLAPLLASIVKIDPFKFAKFNLKRPCTLWPDTFSCTKTGCNIKFCPHGSLPDTFLEFDQNACPADSPKALSKLDQTLPKDSVDELNTLFECSRDDSEESQYYDLILNPERYTGYDGHQIWKAIYEENCFMKHKDQNIFSPLDNKCYEERMFYRSISGLHTSITTHLASIHHKFQNNFGPNPSEYAKRFYGNTDYMKNLFFVYLIELRALYKSEPYLRNKIKWNAISDKVQARDAISALLNTEKLFKWHFDEKVLFRHEPQSSIQQLAAHFHNITYNIMDCVSCDKCRLWGKVQTNGLGTAFKILLTKDSSRLKLSHHEITCLLNSLARLSFSITQISNFNDIYRDKIVMPKTGKNVDFIKFI